MENSETYHSIIKTLKEKSSMKHDVYENTLNAFGMMKSVAFDIVRDIKNNKELKDKRVVIDYRERGDFEFEIRVSGDLLIFSMHTNIFEFEKSHMMFKSSYIKEDHFRSYCGLINIYNFLNDSFKYNRTNDFGYLVGRVFINKEKHYFLEGKRQLGLLHNDFVHETIDQKQIKSILEAIILYCLNFDLYTPPFDSLSEISVSEILAVNESMQVKTGKRLGFRFKSEDDEIEG